MQRGRPPKNIVRKVSSDVESEEENEPVVQPQPEKKDVKSVVSEVVQTAVENQKVVSNNEIKQTLKDEGVSGLTKKDLDAIVEKINTQISKMMEAQEQYYDKIKKEVKKNHLDTQISNSRQQLDGYFKFR